MKKVLDALWRAVAYCFYPRVIVLSLLPLALLGLGAWAFAAWGWQPAMQAMRASLAGGWLDAAFTSVLNVFGWQAYRDALPATLLLFAATPVLVLACLMLVTLLALPTLVPMVARRRFPGLQKKQGIGIWGSMAWSLGYTLFALLLMVLTLPLWFVPPLMLVLPPLIWGWLASKVMTQDVLADYATPQERDHLVKQHRLPLLGMGVATGLLGSAPSVVWASGIVFISLFVVLVPLAIWIYTLVFIFSALWFSHYCLDALQDLRQQTGEGQVVENAGDGVSRP